MAIIRSLVIIPTYNESENIIDLINEIFLLDDNLHILVVDDNSKDKTSNIIKESLKNINFDLEDEILKGCVITHQGSIVNESVK